MNKTLGIALVVVIVIATIGAYQYLKVEQPLGANPGPDIFSFLNVHGVFSQGGGVKTVLQTAEGTHTLTFAEMNDFNVITFTASSTQGALTATLPATTTFPLLNEPGATRSWIIENPFTAAATTTTITSD